MRANQTQEHLRRAEKNCARLRNQVYNMTEWYEITLTPAENLPDRGGPALLKRFAQHALGTYERDIVTNFPHARAADPLLQHAIYRELLTHIPQWGGNVRAGEDILIQQEMFAIKVYLRTQRMFEELVLSRLPSTGFLVRGRFWNVDYTIDLIPEAMWRELNHTNLPPDTSNACFELWPFRARGMTRPNRTHNLMPDEEEHDQDRREHTQAPVQSTLPWNQPPQPSALPWSQNPSPRVPESITHEPDQGLPWHRQTRLL